jgi:hypothetical protein
MDPELARLMDSVTPKLNPILADGLAVHQMKDVAKEVDDMLRAAAASFPPGFQYVTYALCTPEEEFAEVTKRKNKRFLDVARSDLFLIKLLFKYQGEDLDPRYLYLPFVEDAAGIVLSASRFFFIPILTDPGLSVTEKNVFMRFLRDKVTFKRMPHQFLVHGEKRLFRETVQIVWSSIYHTAEKNAKTTLMHYLLAKYGFKETFRRFGKCDPVVGDMHKVNEQNFPLEDWVIVSSAAIKDPHSRKVQTNYVTSTLRIAIPRNQYTQQVRNMLGGFYYVIDMFPQRVTEEYINHTRLWQQLMGTILFTDSIGAGKLIDNVSNHIESLDQYLDHLVQKKLKDTGIDVQDVYELFGIVIERFDEWIVTSNKNVGTMYDKELSILPFVLEEIKQGIFNFYFRITAANRKDGNMRPDQIKAMFNQTLRPGLIHLIRAGHGEVQTILYPGDNKVFKITSSLVPQEASSGTRNKNDRSVMEDPAKCLHVSLSEIGAYSALKKAAPDGRSSLNCHALLDEKGRVQRHPDLVPMLDRAQEVFIQHQ